MNIISSSLQCKVACASSGSLLPEWMDFGPRTLQL